ncbi:MAG: hypothetical protein V4466_05585, partial [Pseudomonadota bacterium]
MKIVSLIAGVAAVALVAGSASAQDIHKGQAYLLGTNVSFTGNTPLVPVTGNFGQQFAAVLQNVGITASNGAGALNAINAGNGASLVSSWHAIGTAADNNGTAAGSDGATF